MTRRVEISVRGAVQGVGFRPFVYGLASRLQLAGFVLNEPQGVEVALEGDSTAIESFLAELRASPPPLARIMDIATREKQPIGDTTFVIRESEQHGDRTVLIAPDLATCADCLDEMSDPADRRYRYPFINCTNCGPRYTIIRDLPYDRANTTMAGFEMCPACRAEYEGPAERRFHAEPTCCPECGPRVWLADVDGNRIDCENPVGEAVRLLSGGRVVAVKGLGGFHLACNAADPVAVRRLRERKHRDLKPFAIMARDMDAAGRLVQLDEAGADLLESRERPIVLSDKRGGHGLAEGVAPRSKSYGVMLPYTPLHHLLMEGPYPALVMTSGNITDEPIAHTNDDALDRLRGVADCFLLHDRPIHIRTDDSVARVVCGGRRFLRRSRGYAPFPIPLPVDTREHEILAVGPEWDNTLCFTREGLAFLSHHIGDLHNAGAYEAFLQAIEHLQDILAVKPVYLACDRHPGYMATRYARDSGAQLIEVQHHHAHVASVLAETGRAAAVIGVSFDGLGWGEAGELWGGEFLTADLGSFERAGHLKPVPQPGGDLAAKNLPRMAFSYLVEAFGEGAEDRARDMMPQFAEEEMAVVKTMIQRGVNCPLTSSLGRLFDTVSVLLGICDYNSFRAQAPMELEAEAQNAPGETGAYKVEVYGSDSAGWVVDTPSLIKSLAEDFVRGVTQSVCAARFHNSIAAFTLDICGRIRNNTGISTVALSGGVFANAFLTERLVALLDNDGFEVLMNSEVPPGDGGISLGQAAVAAWRLSCV